MDVNQLPSVILKYIEASNKPDPAAFVECFSEDAVVWDEGKKHVGKNSIKEWSDHYHFGANVTLEPIEMNYGNNEIVVTFTAFAVLHAAGAAEVSAPSDAVSPGSRYAYVKDPEGNLIEIIQPSGHGIALGTLPPNLQRSRPR